MTPTPLEEATLAGRRLLLKREDVHALGAFKWRGALPVLERYAADGARAVVTASTGNHGAATAWAARRVGLDAIVYAPTTASSAKLALIENDGVEIRQTGADLDEAKEEARAHASQEGLPFFEDGGSPLSTRGMPRSQTRSSLRPRSRLRRSSSRSETARCSAGSGSRLPAPRRRWSESVWPRRRRR
jgi:threonine dehydratase